MRQREHLIGDSLHGLADLLSKGCQSSVQSLITGRINPGHLVTRMHPSVIYMQSYDCADYSPAKGLWNVLEGRTCLLHQLRLHHNS